MLVPSLAQAPLLFVAVTGSAAPMASFAVLSLTRFKVPVTVNGATVSALSME
jgi:hypothetical protein